MRRVFAILVLLILVGCSRKQPPQPVSAQQTPNSAQQQSAQVQPVTEIAKLPSEAVVPDSECKYNSDGNLYSDAELAKLDPTDADAEMKPDGSFAHDLSGPIPERMGDKSPDYKRYIDCERKSSAPDFSTASELGLTLVHLGMHRTEFLKVFPVAFGDQFTFDHFPKDGKEQYTFNAITPTGQLVKHYTLGWRQVVAEFDAEDSLDWLELNEHYAYPTYKTPSHVIRFIRATDGSSWGPPDWQKDGHMQWQYQDTLLILDAMREKNGFAFTMTLSHPAALGTQTGDDKKASSATSAIW